MDPAQRLTENLSDVATLGRYGDTTVVIFRDGSQALELTGEAATQAIEAALTRRALGLDGPAVHQTADGVVYQAHGSDQLRAALTSGIRQTDLMPLLLAGKEVVTFNDGTRAIRHEFTTVKEADKFEMRANAAHSIRDGVPGTYRAGPTIVYEHRIDPPYVENKGAAPAALRPELDRRALYVALTRNDGFRDGPPVSSAIRRNPLLKHVAYVGKALLTEADSTALRARYEALRPEFERHGLTAHYDEHLKLISRTDPNAPLDLGPLHDSSPLTPDFRDMPWRPPDHHARALPHLLESSHLRQVNELLAERIDDPALVTAAESILGRADAELAARLTTEGHVSARVPAHWLPRYVRPGSEIAFHGILEGVNAPNFLGDMPNSVRLTIRGEYIGVTDLSGKPAHAVFRAGVRLKVVAQLESFGERHLLVMQVPEGRDIDSIAISEPRNKPRLSRQLRHHLFQDVERIPAGVWLRDLNNAHDMQLAPHARDRVPVNGLFNVVGHGSEDGNWIGAQRLDADQTASLLLHMPWLSEHDVILLTNCHVGANRHALEIAQWTGHVVIANDSKTWLSLDGYLSTAEPGKLGSSGQLRIFLPDDIVPPK
ncbi:hypothetical protein [Nonomuraea cavernae]|uniref:Uncharacterized protein n=1 Tax=Nonomuraea cavernae TaxID=2045107 RepID=A0A918DP78_9ACTN|nr:hypothetical protein [Nonomuraea cavernae]MCA2189261.1 hypothetical protein [Nonomuraea cavernae]GGO76560.1 hypothetical protein GCM10012289_54180 [Nonomuraea cavernae]